MSESNWLTVKEYAALLRVNIQTVYAAIRAGRLKHPFIRVGGRGRGAIRIDVSRESITERKSA